MQQVAVGSMQFDEAVRRWRSLRDRRNASNSLQGVTFTTGDDARLLDVGNAPLVELTKVGFGAPAPGSERLLPGSGISLAAFRQ